MVTQEDVIEKLKGCLDPELGVNIVDLGLIYGIQLDSGSAYVTMTLTTPGCPLDSYFVKDITTRLKSLKGINNVSVEFTFEPVWNPKKMTQESKDLLGFVN